MLAARGDLPALPRPTLQCRLRSAHRPWSVPAPITAAAPSSPVTAGGARRRRQVRRQTRAVVELMRRSEGLAGHFLFMEDDFLLCPHALRTLTYIISKAHAYFPGPTRTRHTRTDTRARRTPRARPVMLSRQVVCKHKRVWREAQLEKRSSWFLTPERGEEEGGGRCFGRGGVVAAGESETGTSQKVLGPSPAYL